MGEKQDMGASLRDRATRASTEPASSLGHSASVPSAEDIATHIARVIALHGFGSNGSADRHTPPGKEWDVWEWQRRILSVIPEAAEARCRELAVAVLEAIFSRSNDREIDDGIRTAPAYAAEHMRQLNPSMVGLILNLDRLSGVLDGIAARDVLLAKQKPPEPLIERVARAIYENGPWTIPWGDLKLEADDRLVTRQGCLSDARAAIACIAAQAIEAGQGQDPKGLDRNDESAVLAEDAPKEEG